MNVKHYSRLVTTKIQSSGYTAVSRVFGALRVVVPGRELELEKEESG